MTAELNYQHPTTLRAPPNWALWWVEPLRGNWRWLPSALVVAGIFGFYLVVPDGPFDPLLLSAPHITLAFYSIIVGSAIASFAGIRFAVSSRLQSRYRVAAVPEFEHYRPYRRALIVAFVSWIALILGVPLRVAFLIRLPAFNAMRGEIERVDEIRPPKSFMPFRFSQTRKLWSGDKRFAIGMFGDAEAGFIYLPEGERIEDYARDAHGRLIGRWYWFADD